MEAVGNHFPFPEIQVDVMQNGFVCHIFKADVFKSNAFLNVFQRFGIRFVLNMRLLIQQVENPACRKHGHLGG